MQYVVRNGKLQKTVLCSQCTHVPLLRASRTAIDTNGTLSLMQYIGYNGRLTVQFFLTCIPFGAAMDTLIIVLLGQFEPLVGYCVVVSRGVVECGPS
jgi:hypothetical protein